MPVDEGPRFKVGEFNFDGNTVVKTEFLRPLFKLKPGDWYSEKRDPRRPDEVARAVRRRRLLRVHRLPGPGVPDRGREGPLAGPAEPTVNVTMRMQEGEQYFVNRITFTGNTTTRDNVIRREMRLVEGGVVQHRGAEVQRPRLNQLGYFKNLEEQAARTSTSRRRPSSKNEVDVTLKLEEQNRNQLTFGAGVSQFEGFFGQLSFQTSNFLGRGEIADACRCRSARGAELPARVHRAVPVRPQHHRRRSTSTSARCATSTSSRRSPPAATSSTGFPLAELLADVLHLQLRAGAGHRPQPVLLHARARRAEPVPGRLAAARRGRQAHDQQGRRRASSTTRWTTRSSRPAARRLTDQHRPRRRWAATPTSSSRGSRRCS